MCSSNFLKNKLKSVTAVKLLGKLFHCFKELTKNELLEHLKLKTLVICYYMMHGY